MFPGPSKKNRTRKKSRRPRSFYILIASVGAVLMGVLAFFLFRSYDVEGAMRQLRATESDPIACSSDTVYYLKDQTLYANDYSANEKWSTAVLTENMSLAASESLVSVYSSTTVQTFSYDSTPHTPKEFYGNILQVRCGANYVAVLNQDTNGVQHIVLLDKAGNEQRLDFQNKYVLDYGFYDGDNFFVYTIDTTSVIPVSRIATYNGSLANTGNISIQGQLLQKINFFSDHIYAIGTSQVLDMDYLGSKKSEKLIYGWEYIGMYQPRNAEPILAFVPGGEDTSDRVLHTVRLVQNGKSDIYIQMPSSTHTVMMGNNKLYTFTSDTLTVFDLSGNRSGEYSFASEVQRIVPLEGGTHALVYRDSNISMLRLP